MKTWLGSSVAFAAKMLFSATLSLVAISLVLVIVTRLDIAFFESTGMMKNAEIREAFYMQVFDLEGPVLLMLFTGYVAVFVISLLFCKSQFDYFKKLEQALRAFADTGEVPPLAGLGRFNPHAIYFFDVLAKRVKGSPEEEIKPIITKASVEWPTGPFVSWRDQGQFMVIAGLLGLFFSAACVVYYYKVSSRVVELSNSLVRYQSAAGPTFLMEQFEIVNLLIGLVLFVTTLSFMLTGLRFSERIGAADYALLRDMRQFMEGNFTKRLFLRKGDPAREHVAAMNDSIKRIADRIETAR